MNLSTLSANARTKSCRQGSRDLESGVSGKRAASSLAAKEQDRVVSINGNLPLVERLDGQLLSFLLSSHELCLAVETNSHVPLKNN